MFLLKMMNIDTSALIALMLQFVSNAIKVPSIISTNSLLKETLICRGKLLTEGMDHLIMNFSRNKYCQICSQER